MMLIQTTFYQSQIFHRWLITSLCLLGLQTQVFAQADLGQVVEVSLGGSTVLELQAQRATLTDPTIAEIESASGGVLIIGRKVGETNLITTSSGVNQTYLIKVTLPARAIQSELIDLFPLEKNVRAKAVGGALVLEGSVSSTNVVSQIEEVAVGYLLSPSIAALGVKPNVINLLTVKSQQQVQLEVKFVEVNRISLREIGGSFTASKGLSEFAGGYNPSLVKDSVGNYVPTGMTNTSFGTLFLSARNSTFPFSATLNLFAERTLSRTIAEPTLVALSGQKASFLAGGEQPVPQVSGLGVPTVDYKKFGMMMDFTPIVLENQTIELATNVGVSALDFSQGLQINGTKVPLFKTRSSQTTVRLRSGQSFAIAGLLSDEMANSMRYMPGLGQIPILGALFSSKSFKRNETELLVVITARLVNPLEEGSALQLPSDSIVDPNDLEFFILNLFESMDPPERKASPIQRSESEMPKLPAGQVGFWR